MISTEVYFSDDDIFFRVTFSNDHPNNNMYPKTDFVKTLKYSIKRQIMVFTNEELKPQSTQTRTGLRKRKYGLILGKVDYLKKRCFVLTADDTKLADFDNGVLYMASEFVLIDCQTQQEKNKEFYVLNQFFESFSGKLCFYVPFNLSKLVGPDCRSNADSRPRPRRPFDRCLCATRPTSADAGPLRAPGGPRTFH